MSYRVAVFDIDGTLSNPGNALTESARIALEKMGIEETNEAHLRRFVGPPLEHSFKEYYGFSDEQALEAVGHYRHNMQENGVQLTTVYDGIRELLESLKSSGVTLAVATSKVDYIASKVLQTTGLADFFDYVGAETPGQAVKKEVTLAKVLDSIGVTRKTDVVMIGDRRHDIEAARAAGIDSIGVLWGYGTREELDNEGATHIVSSPREILGLFV